VPATIHDVAARAGVSVATVSRSLAAPNTVREGTRGRVLAAAADLGYEPNRGNPYFHAVLKGAQERAREADYSVFVADGQEDAAEEQSLIRAMGKQVDGIVLCSSRLAPAALAALEPTPMLVLLNRKVPGRPSVVVDSAGGMRQALGHLAALGHLRCAFVAGPRRSWSNRERLRGLRGCAGGLGVEIVTLGPVAPQFASGVEVADRLLGTGATAVLAYNDLVAVGILSRLAELGVRVPDELSVIGFDDIPLAAMVTPPLTTVAAPTEHAGRVAIEVLLDRLEHRAASPSAAVQRLTPTLVVRGSTARPALTRTTTALRSA
jgi:DNA-binding LacI/PurR family transcriptional regulator